MAGFVGGLTAWVQTMDAFSFAVVNAIISFLPIPGSASALCLAAGVMFGSLFGTPIINPPQSAVLGMHAIKPRAVVVDGQVVSRPMMYIALTYDHRIVDGREGVGFLKHIKECIEDPQRLLLGI